MGLSGDSGATIRDTMKSLFHFGAPPEMPEYGTGYDVEGFERRV